ncbi:MAG: penicillin-binding protein 2 [Actinobacteria bacterium]|nr:penicillin-binding protein 2 [Actinomycetota bacterium]
MQEGRKRKNLGSYTRIRFRLVVYLLLIIVVVLVVRLYFLQVMSGEVYAAEASENILRTKTVSAPRGDIYDRNGKLLVKSIPVPAVAVDPRIVAGNEEVIHILSDKLNMSINDIVKKLKSTNISYIERIILKSNIDYQTMIYLKENSGKLPGVEVIDVFLREYEYGSLAAHVLGYIGEIDEEKLKMLEYSVEYEGGDQVGLTGIEKTYEHILKGTKGKITYEVDPLGRPKAIVEEIPYAPGNDLFITIDIDLQKMVEEILSDQIIKMRQQKVPREEEYFLVPGGAIVVLDTKKGEVLAMASYPTYDPSVFTGGISASDWNYLNDPVNEFPLNNRAMMGYASGSVFKIVAAYGGFAEGIISPNRYIGCKGVWTSLGEDFPKYCWAKGGHGALNIFGAIQNSCDIFFYQVAYELFVKNKNADELLQKYARILGFGNYTGIDLPYEDKGIVPDREWKKDYFKNQKANTIWFPGDTVNMSIGQGDVLTTPLQMALAYSIIANNGLKVTPHIGKEVRDKGGNLFIELENDEIVDLSLNKEYLDIIEKGLGLVVTSGTAASRFLNFPLKEIPVAGKTGTAEVLGKQDYAWFVCYAPISDPQYLIVVMLEQAGGGSRACAPMARKILEYLFNL